MKILGRELDELEDALVFLAVAGFASSAFLYAIPRVVQLPRGLALPDFALTVLYSVLFFLVFLALLARVLCVFLGAVALALWLLRRFPTPFYQRFRSPRGAIQRLFDR